MATNYVQEGKHLRVPTAEGAKSGDPMVVGGYLTCVLLTDAESDSPYKAQVATTGVFSVSVKAVDASGNNAVEVGDAIYYDSSKDPVLSKRTGGEFFGIALEAISGGNESAILVLIRPKAGLGAVTEATLAPSVQDKIVQLDLTGTDNEDGTGNLAIQAQDADGNNLEERVLCRVWVNDTDNFEAGAINGVTVATGINHEEVTSAADYYVITDTTGLAELTLDLASDGSVYAWASMGGRIHESGEIAVTGNA